MKIDDRVEPLVRTAIDAAVKRNFPKLEAALQAFSDDETTRKAVELALAVVGVAMIELHEGKPDADEIRTVAEKVAEMETWAEPTVDEVNTFLTRLLNGEPFATEVPPENVIVLAFVVAATLLSSGRHEDERWYDFLDRAEAAIESAS